MEGVLSDAAVTVIVSGIITITTTIVGFLTLWIKLRYGVQKAEEVAVKAQIVESKIDTNTAITESAARTMVTNAKIAANTAKEAKDVSSEIADKLNGKLEEKIVLIVKAHVEPLAVALVEHTKVDDENMRQIMGAVSNLNRLIIDNIASKEE